jgi:hypothetical protein
MEESMTGEWLKTKCYRTAVDEVEEDAVARHYFIAAAACWGWMQSTAIGLACVCVLATGAARDVRKVHSFHFVTSLSLAMDDVETVRCYHTCRPYDIILYSECIDEQRCGREALTPMIFSHKQA